MSKQITKTKIVDFNAKEIFDLVADIESYAEFLPWIKEIKIIEKSSNFVKADVSFSYMGVEKTYRSLNRYVKHSRIEIEVQSSSIKKMQSVWLFEELEPNQTKVSYRVDFDFNNRLLKMAFVPAFSTISNSIIELFETRAQEIYAKTKN